MGVLDLPIDSSVLFENNPSHGVGNDIAACLGGGQDRVAEAHHKGGVRNIIWKCYDGSHFAGEERGAQELVALGLGNSSIQEGYDVRGWEFIKVVGGCLKDVEVIGVQD